MDVCFSSEIPQVQDSGHFISNITAMTMNVSDTEMTLLYWAGNRIAEPII